MTAETESKQARTLTGPKYELREVLCVDIDWGKFPPGGTSSLQSTRRKILVPDRKIVKCKTMGWLARTARQEQAKKATKPKGSSSQSYFWRDNKGKLVLIDDLPVNSHKRQVEPPCRKGLIVSSKQSTALVHTVEYSFSLKLPGYRRTPLEESQFLHHVHIKKHSYMVLAFLKLPVG